LNPPKDMTGERRFYRWAGLASLAFMAVPPVALRFGFFSDGLFCFLAAIGVFLAVAGIAKGPRLGKFCAVLALLLLPPLIFQFFHDQY
jgi:hypothetical protein